MIAERRMKCTPEIVAAICRHVLGGASMRSAAGSVGIDYSTLKRWQAWEREGKEPFAALCAPLKKARSEAIVKAEQRVYEGKMGWQAAARWLESISPNPWRRTERREEAGGGGPPVEVDVNLGAELLRKVIAASAKPGVPGLGGGDRRGVSRREGACRRAGPGPLRGSNRLPALVATGEVGREKPRC